jgi:Holliday junction resolvase RusA-like endonuclease
MQTQSLFDDKPKPAPGAIEIELPWPPSVNHYKTQNVILPAAADIESAFSGDWKALWKFIRSKVHVGSFLTEDAKDYHAKVEACAIRANARKYFTANLRMSVWVYPPDRRRRDQSNLLKMIEDALGSARCYEDDSQIKEHHVFFTGEIVEFGKVVVRIEEML